MNLVKATGPLGAKIAIVGEAPGVEEDRVGLPFVGRSGELLSKLLTQAGINRGECYITNVVKIRPPKNAISRVDETGKTMQEWTKILIEELETVNPNVVIALGSTAMKVLTSKLYISKQRGSILECSRVKGLKVIPTYHPASLLYGMKSSEGDPSNKVSDMPLVIFDLQKALRESKFPDFGSILERTIIVEPHYEQVIKTLELILDKGFVSLDIETDMGARIIQCVGLAWSETEAIVIPIYTKKPYWAEHEEIAIWRGIARILNHPKIGKIIQNESFERSVLYPWVGAIEPVWMDTMVGHHLCLPELKKDLGTIVSIYTNEPYFKDDARNSDYGNLATWEYNGKDCTSTYESAMAIRKDLASFRLEDFYDSYQRPFASIMWNAQERGILCDTAFVLRKKLEIQQQVVKDQEEINKLVGKEINTASPKQMYWLLYEHMKLPFKTNRVTGRPTTNEEALEKLRIRFPSPILSLVSKIRKQEKLISTYLAGAKSGRKVWSDDGRIRCSWVLTGTVTGRLSSRTNIWKTGMNLQNIPSPQTSDIRRMFMADPGCVFVKVDLSQVEARLVAYISGNKKMISVFERGEDIHSMLASWIYKKPLEQVGKGSYERSLSKKLVHAGNYGLGPNKFSFLTEVTVAEAKFLLSEYDRQFGISTWHREVEWALKKDRTLITPLGRRRQFFGWWGQDLFRSAYAYLPQSTAGDLINRAAVRIYPQLPQGADLLLQVHDEWVCQCREADVGKVIALYKKEILKPITINNHQVVIPIDLAVGKNWYDMEEIK